MRDLVSKHNVKTNRERERETNTVDMWSLLVHIRFHVYMHIPVQTCSTHEITQVFFFFPVESTIFRSLVLESMNAEWKFLENYT